MTTIKTTTTAARKTGHVKWVNKKSGYGFITMHPETESDVFVHFSNIRASSCAIKPRDAWRIDDNNNDENEKTEFRYLIKGEYIEFLLNESTNSKFKYFASDITGIHEGHLMFDIMHENKAYHNHLKNTRRVNNVELDENHVFSAEETSTQRID